MSVVLRVEVGQLQNWLRLDPARQTEAVQIFQNEGSQIVMEEMRGNVPFKTGFLRESITSELLPDGFKVYAAAPYAGFVDQGTGPHVIFPRVAKTLRFELPSGAVIFARSVHHPGFPGRFFTLKTAEAVLAKLQDLMNRILDGVYGAG